MAWSDAPRAMKTFVLKSPDGEIIKGGGLSKFARENNLDNNLIGKVVKGEIWQHKGWTRPDKTKADFVNWACGCITLKSPGGEIVKRGSLGEFCKEFGLERKYLILVVNGRKGKYRGWTLP